MKKSNKAMRMQLGSFTLVLALSCWTPGGVLAEENQGGAAAQQEQAADQQQDQQNKPTVTVDDQQTTKVPVAEVEVKAEKEKKKKLTIGQQPDAEGINDYVVTKSSTGSKSEVENKDLPQSISVVSQKIMEEQRYTNFADALANVSGIASLADIPSYTATGQYSIRGFSSYPYVNVNGMWDPASTMSNWVGNLERIEVLKGPAAVLYGNGLPGGLINYVTKKPLPYYKFTLGTEFHSWGGKSQDIDMSLPLTKDNKWLSRTIIQNADYRVFQKGVKYKRFDGSVIIQGQPKDDTTYTFQFDFHDHDGTTKAGGIAINKNIAIPAPYDIIPYDGNYYNPKAKTHFVSHSVSGQVEHKINDIWTIRSALRYSDASTAGVSQGGTSLNATTLKVSQSWSKYSYQKDTFAWDTTANAKFKAWGLNHNLVTGFTWARYTYYRPYYYSGSLDSVDLYNPIFADVDTLTNGKSSGTSSSYTYRMGSYINDVIELSPKWKLSQGISFTSMREDGENPNKSGKSWRVGTTYEASPGTAFFIGYSTSYDPQGSQENDAGKVFYFKPETGDQIEGGVKFDISNRASATLSIYRINRQNLVFYVDDTDEWIQIGDQRSKGFDLDATYVIRPGWNVLAAYSYCDARYVKDRSNSGLRIPNMSPVSFRLWSTYEIQEGPRKGLGFGGGVTHISRYPANQPNTVWVDGYNRIDGVIYYKTKDWRYSLNVYNLTNKKYWRLAGSSLAYAGAPRNFIFRVEKSFF